MSTETKGTAPKVTLADLEDAILSEHYFNGDHGVGGAIANGLGDVQVYAPDFMAGGIVPRERLGLITFCVFILRNGFTVTGESACVSAANFDAALGRKYAREKAIDKLWLMMGYGLADRLHRTGAP
jgi:hypothetical protein